MSTYFNNLLDAIARSELGIETLATRGDEPFARHNIDIASLKRALHRAYLAGADETAARILSITRNTGDNT